jgi:dipeptidyl aminopeptidase/acylaminoacyl peptidase
MSISYNPSPRRAGYVRSMNLTSVAKLLLAIAASTAAAFTLHGQTPAAASAGPLGPIAFFTAHEWDAKLPDSPDGKKMKIHAVFTWAQNRQAIRISNQFVTDGKASPYLDGLYAWDPKQRAIVFWYVDAKGSLSTGTVKLEDGKLVHEFQETQPDGKTAAFVARVTPQGDRAWENEILARKENALVAVVKVRYEAAE